MLATPPECTYDVFISYSHRDKAWVRGELLPRLESAGLKSCIDYRDFRIGAPIIKEMERAVLTSRHTLAVLTPAYLESAWADFEALMVATLDPGSQKERLLPLLLAPCDLPLRVKYLGYADFTAPDEADLSWQRLLAALQELSHTGAAAKTQVDVEQKVGMVTGGQVAGVKVDTISGPVTINITGPVPAQTSAPAPTPEPALDTATVRELLTAAFSDEELTTFCFDYYRTVYEQFASGMSRTRKVQILVEHCERRGQTVEMLAQVKGVNPYQYQRFESRLRN